MSSDCGKKKTLMLASNNKGKIAEFREMLGCDVITPKDIGIDFNVDETGKTFEENAFIKAKALFDICGKPTIADDSGLCVEALQGRPGVFSARYSGGGDKANNAKLLQELINVSDRRAKFVCVIAYVDGEHTLTAKGETYGVIGDCEQGENGFGYDPLFISDDLKTCFGLASESQKNSVSHRARAINNLKSLLTINKLI